MIEFRAGALVEIRVEAQQSNLPNAVRRQRFRHVALDIGDILTNISGRQHVGADRIEVAARLHEGVVVGFLELPVRRNTMQVPVVLDGIRHPLESVEQHDPAVRHAALEKRQGDDHRRSAAPDPAFHEIAGNAGIEHVMDGIVEGEAAIDARHRVGPHLAPDRGKALPGRCPDGQSPPLPA